MENGGHKKKQSFCLHPLSLFPLNFDNNTDIARTNLKKKPNTDKRPWIYKYTKTDIKKKLTVHL